MNPTVVARALLVSLIATLTAAVLGFAPATAALASPSASPLATSAPAVMAAPAVVPGSSSGLRVVALSSLPSQATDTYHRIQSGGPYPFSQDNTVFSNREGILPAERSGYYHEYTVITPGSPDRGARRIIAGSNREIYYTGDHYASFVVVDVTR